MRENNNKFGYSLWVGLIAAIFFVPFLGGVHLFDWDEINFAEISREMLLTGDYTRCYIDFQPFWEKPPLFFWLQSFAMRVLGVGELAARLPNAVCGIITLIVLFRIGRSLFTTRFGLLWALAFFGSILPHLYFKSGIIDPWFNLFIFCGLYGLVLALWHKHEDTSLRHTKSKRWYLSWGGVFIGLAMLTKGPVALLIVGLSILGYGVFRRFRNYFNIGELFYFAVFSMLVAMIWLGWETWKNGTWFVEEFTRYQVRLFSTGDAGHSGFPGFHLVVLLVGCFPASVFAIRGFLKISDTIRNDQYDFVLWMKILFWVVLILFSIVQSKIIHYSSLCYFPLSFLAARTIDNILNERIQFANWMKVVLLIIGGVFMSAILALPFVGQNIDLLKPLFNDPFAVANMEASVIWTGWECIPAVLLLAVLMIAFYGKKLMNKRYRIALLFIGTAVFVQLALFFSIGKIEHYSQRAAIEFFQSKAKEDCYIRPMGYKTYGHLFYAQKQPVVNVNSYDVNWLMSDAADKPVYVITKIHKVDQVMQQFPFLKKIGEKNGFVFLKKQ